MCAYVLIRKVFLGARKHQLMSIKVRNFLRIFCRCASTMASIDAIVLAHLQKIRRKFFTLMLIWSSGGDISHYMFESNNE
jgi:hypothetical protein